MKNFRITLFLFICLSLPSHSVAKLNWCPQFTNHIKNFEEKMYHREISEELYSLLSKTPYDDVNAQKIKEEFFSLEKLRRKQKWQRAIDLSLLVLGLPAYAPLLVFTAVGVKLESKGPIFFLQPRVGKDGQIFRIWKFRSMKVEDSQVAGGLKESTKEQDPRITGAFGRFIRRWKLDELPQLINVVKGEMSFVGPRPRVTKEIEELTEKFPAFSWRVIQKPGLTSISTTVVEWKFNSPEQNLKKLKLDLAATQDYSTKEYFNALAMTVWHIFKGKGSR